MPADRAAFDAAPSPLDAWLDAQCPPDDGIREAASLPDRLAAAQLRALNEVVARAATRSRWYGRALASCDLTLHNFTDLARLPFTTPQDIRDYRDFLCVSQGDVRRVVTLQTSGSTGTPKRLAFSEADIARTASFFFVGMQQLVSKGQRLLVLLPGAQCPDGVTDVLRKALHPLDVEVSGGDPAVTPQSLRADLMAHRPHCLVAAPHQLEALLTAVRQDAPLLRLAQCVDGIQSSGDILEDAVRHGLQDALHCRVYDHFGMTETGFGGGVECRVHSGYHMRELDVFIEIIDPDTNALLPEGEVGEMVLTTLNREAMPLIRYRTGDAAAWLPAPCPCGSPLRRLSRLRGRYCTEGGTRVLRHIRKGGFDARPHPSTLR